jgi:hypothetical protein
MEEELNKRKAIEENYTATFFSFLCSAHSLALSDIARQKAAALS